MNYQKRCTCQQMFHPAQTSNADSISDHWFGAFRIHQPRTRIIFGVNSVERAGELAREVGAKKVLLVTDQGIFVAAGHAARVRRLLTETAGLKVTLFGKAREVCRGNG